MKTFAIHSPNDADILIRMHDDLMKAGFKDDAEWNDRCNPRYFKWSYNDGEYHMVVNFEGWNEISYHSARPYADEHRDLTPDNYDSILSEIIEANKP